MTSEQKVEIVRLILEFALTRSPNAKGDVIPDSVQQTLKLLFPNGV